MEEVTEREQKLIDHIKHLIAVVSAHSWFINNYMRKGYEWYYRTVDDGKWETKQEELLDFLKEEFGINYDTITDEMLENMKKEK